jgi:eukaryotic-like serine/threonine-protein kinase
MAEVFKAKSFGVAGFERIVAVKRILPTLAEDEEFITMFIDEARIAAHLTHQNIVQIYELGASDSNYFISMEYVAGRDLRQMLDLQKKMKKPMETAKSCFVVSQVCEALEYAHRKRDPAGKDLKIIHRDVTPQNVIISFEGEVKLCDFGIAKAASRASRTQVGVLKGKFAYMSPEQVRGQPTDRRSDLFALGVIFYEMLTGERLFLGESDYSTLESVRNARVPAPRKFNPNLSKELETIVLKLLARDPKDRYQWASEVHEDLQDHLIHEGRVFHARHLRTSMQDTYARDIEIENAKLEEFMKLRLPEPSEDEDEEEDAAQDSSLLGVEEEKGREQPQDPANYSRTYAPIDESAASDDTDNLEIPVPRAGKDSIPTRPIDYESPETKRALEGGAIPSIGSPSPVSNLFGAPELSDPDEPKSDPEGPISGDPIVIVPKDSHDNVDQTAVELAAQEEEFVEETPHEEAERTQFDMHPLTELEGGDSNETLFDDKDDTVGGDEASINEEIESAKEALMKRLDRVSKAEGGEENDTIDSTSTSSDVMAPSIQDPSEIMEDETSVSPMVLGEADGYAPTMIRPQSDEFAAAGGDTNEETPSFGVDEGTVEEAPSEMMGKRPLPPTQQQEQSPPKRARRIREEKTPKLGSPPKPVPQALQRTEPSAPSPLVHASPSHSSPSPMQPVVIEQSGIARAARDPVVLMLIAAAVGLLSVSVLAFTLLQGGGDDSTASLQILTEPTRAVEVKLDGAVVGKETPVDIPGIELGMHVVELSAAGYRTYTQKIQIAQAKPHTMVVPLEAVAHVQPRAEVTDVRDPDPPPPPPPAVAEDPPEDADPPPPPPPPPPAPRPQAVPNKPSEGYLIVSTTPPGLPVSIDGKATGLRTPIRHPEALSPGKHIVTVTMDDGKKYDFEVKITSGQTTKLVRPLR